MGTNKTRKAPVGGTEKTRNGFSRGGLVWNEATETWDDYETETWDNAGSEVTFDTAGTNKVRQSAPLGTNKIRN